MTDAFRLITSGRAEARVPAPAKGQRVRGAHAPCALDASNQPFPVCSHHLPRDVERCVSVMSTGVWWSAYYASVHLADATSRDLAEMTIASWKHST